MGNIENLRPFRAGDERARAMGSKGGRASAASRAARIEQAARISAAFYNFELRDLCKRLARECDRLAGRLDQARTDRDKYRHKYNQLKRTYESEKKRER